MDFASMHRFRRSIFCRAGKDIDRRLVPQLLSGLWANAEIELLAPEADTPDAFIFRAGNGAEIATRDPYFADFLTQLGAAFPSSIPVDDIESHPEPRFAVKGSPIRILPDSIMDARLFRWFTGQASAI
jgi:hypothetical protein